MTESKLAAKDLHVGWDKHVVAKLNELIVHGGEIVVLAGPNGAGKSTLVKTIARQVPPLSGTATINGADMFSLSQRDFARHIAYVPQLVEAPKAMRVEEMVMLGRNPHQNWWSWESSPTDHAAVESALQHTETLALRDRAFSDLSGGERQRVLVAMALAQQTPFILLDEPTAHLDFKHQMQLMSLLSGLKAQGLGVLMVLHDLNLIGRVADNVVLLQKPDNAPSSVAASGTPAQVLTADTLKKVYEVAVAITHDAATGITSYTPVSAE
jgi:iron complex transport system ATP-binding protein